MFKYFKVIVLVLGMLVSINATDGGQLLEHQHSITSVTDGAFMGVTDMIIFNDTVQCYNYSLVVLWDTVDAVKYAFFDPFLSVETFGLVVHKLPLVYLECNRVIDDLKLVQSVFNILSDDVKNPELWYWLIKNIMFNLGDVFRNLYEA